MFRINRQTEYAIRMLLSLSKREAGSRTSTTEIQQEMVIPRSFAQHIIADLARGSFVRTFPGRDGGVMLARPARDINLLQLLEYFEAHYFSSGCQNSTGDCPFRDECPICFQLERLKSVMSHELECVNLEDMANSSKGTAFFVMNNFPQRISASV